MADANNPNDDVTLIYDGQCPVCTAYSCNVDAGPARLNLVDARSERAEVKGAVEAGIDLDEGMVVVIGGRRYHGADAMHQMALLAPRSGLRNRLNRVAFGNRAVARAIYPALRTGRNALLRLLGRQKIGRGKQAN